MDGLARPTLALGLIGAVMVVAMAAADQPCSVKELMPCLQTVKGAYPPEPDHSCCSAVMDANPTCLCNEFVNSSLPPNFIRNVLAIPKACGRTQLSGFHCGIYTIE